MRRHLKSQETFTDDKGTFKVLRSDMSTDKLWYLCEALDGSDKGTEAWKQVPWAHHPEADPLVPSAYQR